MGKKQHQRGVLLKAHIGVATILLHGGAPGRGFNTSVKVLGRAADGKIRECSVVVLLSRAAKSLQHRGFIIIFPGTRKECASDKSVALCLYY